MQADYRLQVTLDLDFPVRSADGGFLVEWGFFSNSLCRITRGGVRLSTARQFTHHTLEYQPHRQFPSSRPTPGRDTMNSDGSDRPLDAVNIDPRWFVTKNA